MSCPRLTRKLSRRSRRVTFCPFAAGNRQGQLCWSSQLWFQRPERLLLLAGDSPIGYRIPTESMPWVAPDELEYEYEAAPFADRVKLPARPSRRMDLFEIKSRGRSASRSLERVRNAPELIRPSLCVQAREGRLHVFLPYAPQLADYLDLVARRRRYVPASAQAGVAGGLPSAVRSAVAIVQRHSRSRGSGSEPAAGEQLGRTRTDQHAARSKKRAEIA